MSDKNRVLHFTPRLFLIVGCSLLVALLLTLLFATHSTSNQKTSTAVTFQVHIGFDGRYKNGTWVPVYVTLSNTGPDFTGLLSITPPASLSDSEWPSTLYQSAITLPTGAQKQVTLYIPLKASAPDASQMLNVQLLDTHDHLLLTHATFVHPLNPQDVFVGLLSDQPGNFSAFTNVELPDHTATLLTEPLNANTFPTQAAALDNFDMLVLDDFTSSTLNNDQLRTLQAWIQRGGTLVEIGGPSWQRSLLSLPQNLIPVTVTGTTLFSNPISSLSINDAPLQVKPTLDTQNLQNPILISKATLAHSPAGTISTIILSQGTIPLMVQRQQGQGTLYYLAFDPTLEPLANWSGIHTFWQSLLLRTLGDQLLTPNTGAPILPANGTVGAVPNLPLIGIGMEDLLYAMLPHTLPLPWPLLIILFSYLLILGPIRFLVVRSTRKRWSWHIIVSSLVVFSGLSYGLALYEKKDAILSNSISILQFNQNGSPAHMTTYTGIFLPDQGTFHVTVPGINIAQVLPKTTTTNASSSQQVHIIANENDTTVNLNGDHTWMMHTIISEQERQINGSIVPHLTLDHDAVVGTLTNTLPYSLTDSYILLGKSYIHSGPLPTHGTRSISSSFRNTTDPLETLADQITTDGGLPAAYNLNANLLQTKSLADLHLETLTALSGELSTFACGLNVCVTNSGKSQQLFGNPVMFSAPGSDPLLLANTSATLIGWADQESDHTNISSVDGTISKGTHETLLQIPLTMHFPDLTPVPFHSLTANLIDVQGNNIQAQTGIYLMTTGSMTFEFPVPSTLDVKARPLAISLLPYPPSGIYQLENAAARNIADEQHLHVTLYNWQSRTWDTTTLNQFTIFVTQPAYIGPNQRVLFKLTNHDASRGTFVLGTPIVTL
ncbi:MAG: hypothetical protein H0V70_13390 [Ktedonobacteraceae bacterium]|nr:hypothetical protein [Ktedonobacteraceae bacterium]